LISVTSTTFAGIAVIPVAKSPVLTTSYAVGTPHPAMEALGAFSTKALARLYGTPALVVLVCISPATKRAVCSGILEAIIAVIRIVRLRPEVKSLWSISELGVFDTLFDLTDTKPSVSHRVGRGKVCSWRSENDIFGVYSR
jgi:hypothetical protein